MNTTHSVAPEEVMAFLDGELSAALARAISNHLEQCAECVAVAEQFRNTSQSLSHWSVPAVPPKLEQPIRDLADKTRLGVRTGRPGFFVRTSFWNWRQWTFGLGSMVTAVLILITIWTPNLLRSRKSEFDNLEQYARISAHARSGTNSSSSELRTGEFGSAGKRELPMNGRAGGFDKISGQLDTDEKSKVFPKVVPGGISLPPAVTRSDGALHGLGDDAEDSVSSDGQAPMMARTVSLSIVVKDFAASRSSLEAILARHHGYSAQLNVATPENAPRSIQASLRIPATKLSSAVADLKLLGRVENESQSGEEVTRQHTDLVARLKTSRETEQRFRSILQQRTGNVVEVLRVEEGIARVRGDIERMEAEQKALEHRVDFTTVELQLTEEYKAQLNPPAPSVSIRVHNSFVAGYHNACETLLGILLFFAEYGLTLLLWLIILTIVLAFPVIFVKRRYRKALAAA